MAVYALDQPLQLPQATPPPDWAMVASGTEELKMQSIDLQALPILEAEGFSENFLPWKVKMVAFLRRHMILEGRFALRSILTRLDGLICEFAAEWVLSHRHAPPTVAELFAVIESQYLIGNLKGRAEQELQRFKRGPNEEPQPMAGRINNLAKIAWTNDEIRCSAAVQERLVQIFACNSIPQVQRKIAARNPQSLAEAVKIAVEAVEIQSRFTAMQPTALPALPVATPRVETGIAVPSAAKVGHAIVNKTTLGPTTITASPMTQTLAIADAPAHVAPPQGLPVYPGDGGPNVKGLPGAWLIGVIDELNQAQAEVQKQAEADNPDFEVTVAPIFRDGKVVSWSTKLKPKLGSNSAKPSSQSRGRSSDRKNIHNAKDRSSSQNTTESQKGIKCFACGGQGHFRRECPTPETMRPKRDNTPRADTRKPITDAERKTVTCYACDGPGHYSFECPTPKEYRIEPRRRSPGPKKPPAENAEGIEK
jgi:hypothetical protein